MKNIKQEKTNVTRLVIFVILIISLLIINPYITTTILATIATILLLKQDVIFTTHHSPKYLQKTDKTNNKSVQDKQLTFQETIPIKYLPPPIYNKTVIKLERGKRYLQIALNNTLEEAEKIISKIPISDRILIEVGTPLIKIYGAEAVSIIKTLSPPETYIVADNKCADLAEFEIKTMADAGANAATCLGVAPIETIDNFVEECQKYNIDSIVDMMNIEDPIRVLKKIKKIPNVIMLHRGVDETKFSKEKQIPYYQIKQIKGNYNTLVAVAGADTIKEVQQAILNDVDIVVLWKSFYQSNEKISQIATSFLKEIR